MKVKQRTYILLIFYLLATPYGKGQQGDNPFELTPRLEVSVDPAAINPEDTGNPFDIVAPAGAGKTIPKKPAPTPVPEVVVDDKPANDNNILVIANVVILLLLTILVTLFRSHLGRSYRAFLNDNLLSQLQRERDTVGGLPYYLFYIVSLLTGGLFTFLIAKAYGLIPEQSHYFHLLLCAGLVIVFFLFKHLLLSIIAYIFPVSKEVALYNMTIIVFSIMIGLFLLPANLLLSFGSETISQGTIYVALAGILLIYAFQSLRALFIANKFLLFHKFHFLLYICTVEVVPIVILARLLLG
jgi:hypothetical protein